MGAAGRQEGVADPQKAAGRQVGVGPQRVAGLQVGAGLVVGTVHQVVPVPQEGNGLRGAAADILAVLEILAAASLTEDLQVQNKARITNDGRLHFLTYAVVSVKN